MIIFIGLLGIIVLLSIKDREKEFLAHDQTTIINGIFVILIFLSHCTQYISLSNIIIDELYLRFQNFHNQWIVTTFLAFSGYGVMYKIISDGDKYIKTYPNNRLLKTLIDFDIAVLIYLFVDILLGKKYSLLTILGSFIGITEIGNSNWYIFTILLMYLFSYISALIMKDNYKGIVVSVSICSILYVIAAQLLGLPSRFVSTVITYALGMCIALYKDHVFTFLKNKGVLSLIVIGVPIIVTYKFRSNDWIMNLSSIFFVLIILWFMARFEIKNDLLFFLGQHAFSIYILQRLPMLVISHYYQPANLIKYLFVIIFFILTIGLSVIYDKYINRINKKIKNN